MKLKSFLSFEEFRNRKDSIEEAESKTLFHAGDDDKVEGTGYKDAEAANRTVDIINKLKKKDHNHAMAIATTMMNRAKTHKYPTPDMKKAVEIFAKWIEQNRKT